MSIPGVKRPFLFASIPAAIIISLLLVSPVFAAVEHDLLQVKRLSDRILTIGSFTGNSTIVAVKGEKGLVLINTLWAPSIAAEAAEIIKQEFGRSDFIYLVNTTGGDSTSRGNAAFPGVTVIGHEDCRKHLSEQTPDVLGAALARRADEFHERVVRTTNQLEAAEAGSDNARFLQAWIDLCAWIEIDMRRGYDIVLPNITFNDRMTLDLGDLTIELVYFGITDNFGETFVKIPEESFFYLSDAFHSLHALPRPDEIESEETLTRWLDVLDEIADEGDENSIIVRANSQAEWDIARIVEQREFISQIWDKVKQANAEGMNIDQALDSLTPVEEVFPQIKAWQSYTEYGTLFLEPDILNLAAAIWKTNHTSAASEIAKVMANEGPTEAAAKLAELRAIPGNEYYFSEREFNREGYAFIGEEKYTEAIAMFKLGIECWPESWNLYDSLGEAYMLSGDTEHAIESYLKSVELNPDNENGKSMLIRLQGK